MWSLDKTAFFLNKLGVRNLKPSSITNKLRLEIPLCLYLAQKFLPFKGLSENMDFVGEDFLFIRSFAQRLFEAL